MDHADRPVFIVRRGDRLAARIKALLLGWRFSNQVGGQLIFCWFPRDRSLYDALPPEPYTASLVWDLPQFYAQRGFNELVFMDGDYRRSDPFPSLSDAEYAEYHKPGFPRELFQGKPLTFLENDHIRHRFVGETEETVTEQIRTLFDRLPLNQYVEATLKRARQELGDSPYVALHVRRGDILSLFRNALPELQEGVTSEVVLKYVRAAFGYTAPLEWYDASIDAALSAGERVVYFSDSPETFEYFERRHGRRKIIKASDLVRGLRVSLQQAMGEFLLIKSAQRVIGTRSSFAGFAARLGGAPVINVQATGTKEGFEKYFFGEILQGTPLSAEVSERLMDALNHR